MTQPPPASPQIHVFASPALVQVAAGASAVLDLTVTNLSEDSQQQRIAVEGVPAAWVAIDFDESRQAYAREQRSAIVTLSIPEGTQTGSLRFRVVALAGEERSAADCVLQVEGVAPPPEPGGEDEHRVPAPGLSLNPAEVRIEAGGEDSTLIRVAVRNVGERETEFLLELEGLDRMWFELPARLRVPAGESIDVELRLRPPLSATAGEYPFTIRAAPQQNAAASAAASGELTILARAAEPSAPPEAQPSQERASEAAAAVPPDVTLGPETSFRFGPGEVTEQAVLSVTNRSGLLEGYSVTLEGLPGGWYRLPLDQLRLEPGATQEVPLRLTPAPGSEHGAGDYPFRIRVAPHGAPDAFSEVGGQLSIIGTQAFDARVAPLQATGRRETYKVTLRNTGTQPISLWMEGTDPDGMCRFDSPPPPNLEPGEERVLPVKVGVRRNRLVGRAETYDFSLRVLPAGGESSSGRNFDARIVHQPYFTRRMVRWTILGCLAAIIIGVVVGIGPSRIWESNTWVRCRFNGTASTCTPVAPRVPNTPRLELPPADGGAPAVLLLPPLDDPLFVLHDGAPDDEVDA